MEAIQIATKNGADFLGISDRVGTVSAGKQADLIVVGGDPATNISDIEKIEFVFRKGVGYDPVKLLEEIDGVVGLEIEFQRLPGVVGQQRCPPLRS